jgi:uncharacterized protein
MTDTAALLDTLIRDVARFDAVAVAFSGGVDSSVVAAIAHRACGQRAVAMTATSAALASGELQQARLVAACIGIRHLVISARETDDEDYRRNPVNRCYFCKRQLYERIRGRCRTGVTILSGTNQDDLGDWRPGLLAAEEAGVHHPLSAAGVTKVQVRALAAALGLPNAAKPASPCLASRIPYGTPVTVQLLRRVDRAESNVRGLGYREFRVRHHGATATVELSAPELANLTSQARPQLVAAVVDAGYSQCEISSQPLRSGSLNPAEFAQHERS